MMMTKKTMLFDVVSFFKVFQGFFYWGLAGSFSSLLAEGDDGDGAALAAAELHRRSLQLLGDDELCAKSNGIFG